MDEIISKAATLLEALPYIQRFRSQVFVVKYGGSFMDSDDPEVRHRVARDVVFLETVGINPVVVHGGGKAITRALEETGLIAQFVQGYRVTDAATAEIVDRGFVGEVVDVNTEPLRECIRRSVTPVISPTARGDNGKTYNCNADVAAARTAIALKARRLVFMSDVPGLLRDPKDDSTLMSHLRALDVPELKRAGVIGEGMLPKVDSAIAAIETGVEKVQFVDGRIPHSVLLEIFTDAGVGTEVVR